MSRFRRSAMAAVLLLVGVFVAVSPADAATAVRDSGASTMPRYYADTVEVSAVGVDECSKPLEDREGAWLCPASDVSASAASCSVFGCWSYDASYQTTFTGKGAYGWEDTILGYTDFQIRLRFSGGSSTSRPFTFRSTRGIKSIGCSGEGIYFSSAQPGGKGINNGASFRTWNGGSYSANTTVNCFGSNGYTVNAAGVAWAGVAYQVQWTDPSSRYGGTWWVWVKSPKFERLSSGAYRSANPPTMGTDWYGSGWDPR